MLFRSNLFPLFIEVGMLTKIRYKLECVLISKKLKKIGSILIRRSPSRAKLWANQNLGSADRHLSCVEWPSWMPSPCLSFGPIWTPFLRIFETGIVPRRIFNLYSKN